MKHNNKKGELMKFTIGSINTDILNDKIYEFENIYNVTPYIICNKDTQESIAHAVGFKPSAKEPQGYGLIAAYSGHKVLTDNSLPFGVVDIR
jgi:hypothetical protein